MSLRIYFQKLFQSVIVFIKICYQECITKTEWTNLLRKCFFFIIILQCGRSHVHETKFCPSSTGINSFKTFMAYKDVFMLSDEEVEIDYM